jgi:NAD(P)-dependent dehydrogenase (short-subunit alcohol dehydrogenase family)
MSLPSSEPSPIAATALAGKTALVTGAGRGLGRGIALAMAQAGAEVILVSRSAAELDTVAAEVAALGAKARAEPCDVTDQSEFASLVERIERVDVLVNNAGMNLPQPFVDVTRENYAAMTALNVSATFFVTQAVVRKMIAEGGGGAIINVTSQMGHVGATNRSVYCATKHAIEGLTKALAVELAPHGIRVASVAPTYIDTPMTRPFFEDPATLADARERIPLGRIGRVEEVTAAVVFLASSGASLITGASVLIDGGYTAQ